MRFHIVTSNLLSRFGAGAFCVVTTIGLCSVGCGNSNSTGNGSVGGNGQGGTNAQGGTKTSGSTQGGTNAGGNSTSGSKSTGGGCAKSTTTVRPHPQVFDYKGCAECHGSLYWGGWVYSNAAGDAWIEDATVTLTGSDGSAPITMQTANNGFFSLKTSEVTIPSTFTPCVSKCGVKNCAPAAHTNPDCQSSSCHGATNHLIYVNQNTGGAQNTGGTTSTSTSCAAPASGGPRVHDTSFDDQLCFSCHDASYVGGYLYDGPSSKTAVSMATLTIKPTNGSAIKAVTGPGGMFEIKGTLTAPYTACVSKCPDSLCSASTTHTNTDDCSTCHTSQLRIHLP